MPRQLVTLALLLILSAVTANPPASSSATTIDPVTPQPESVVRAPEVKLRKLHLVRPDLIPFPIFFEVYA